jgi:hypothetical protein
MADLLTLKDRCDACSAAAYVRVVIVEEPGLLDFCAHHYAKHIDAMRLQLGVIDVIDERYKLEVKV